MANVLKQPNLSGDVNLFCPGCGHGIMAKLINIVLQEEGLDDIAIGAGAVGCCCMIKFNIRTDWIQAQHGRAAAVANGMKGARPDNFVFTYQGDGDAGSIGIAETIYAAKRNDPITVFFVNNGVYGMTGGQTAPTSLDDQTTTTAAKVDYAQFGEPLKLAELLGTFNVGYVARGSLANFKEIQKTKEYIRKAVRCQMAGKGYSFVEVLSPCPTNWKMDPLDAFDRIENVMMPFFPCGEIVTKGID